MRQWLTVAAQRVALQLPPRRAPSDDIKKATISRAEGGQLQAPVGPRGGSAFRVVSECFIEHSKQYSTPDNTAHSESQTDATRSPATTDCHMMDTSAAPLSVGFCHGVYSDSNMLEHHSAALSFD